MTEFEIGREVSDETAFLFVFETEGQNHVRILRLTKDRNFRSSVPHNDIEESVGGKTMTAHTDVASGKGFPDENAKGTGGKDDVRCGKVCDQACLFDYTWPSPLKITAECSKGEWQDGIFTFTLQITSRHAQHAEAGEFTEEEFFAIEDAITDHPVCRVIRIVRRNAHTGAVRVLPHLPVQTYPPVDGRQGPYGHPKVRTHPVIPRRRINPYNKG